MEPKLIVPPEPPKVELSYAERSLLASALMNRQYLTTIVVMMVVAVILSVGVIYLRPEADPLIVVGIVFGIFSPLTGAILNLMKGQETHLSMNSQFTKYVKAQTDVAEIRGEQAGVEQERERKETA